MSNNDEIFIGLFSYEGAIIEETKTEEVKLKLNKIFNEFNRNSIFPNAITLNENLSLKRYYNSLNHNKWYTCYETERAGYTHFLTLVMDHFYNFSKPQTRDDRTVSDVFFDKTLINDKYNVYVGKQSKVSI